jgi:phosphoribosylformylglycinamidine cyclo-ligase
MAEGDVVLGIPSSGLHTNGYSLVRKIFGIDRDPMNLKMVYPELGSTLGEALLVPHRCYYNDLKQFLGKVNGLAHITGGGFVGNIPRILPAGVSVEIDRSTWQAPVLFEIIQKQGGIKDSEMFRVFNMGIGMIVVAGQQDVDGICSGIPDARLIGKVVKANGSERVIIK